MRSVHLTGRARAMWLAFAMVSSASSAWAQSAITGTVRDTTGAVLPGVTVEASSPALIEKVRAVQTDSAGQYRIVELRPGVYTVSFTLAGFSTVVREGIVLESDFVAPVNAEMKVGSLEETVTVTGQSPVVDVSSTQRREVLPSEVVDRLPTARTYQTVMATLPAVNNAAGGQFDVGGSSQMWQGQAAAYGGLSTDFKINIDGLDTSITLSAGMHSGLYLNDGGFQEYVYQVSAGNAETQTAGIKLNLIPKTGGNRFTGQLVTSFANEQMQSSNLTDELRARGVSAPPNLYRSYDFNPSLGGPIIKDRLWFFTSYRVWAFNNYIINVRNPDGTPFHDTNNAQAVPVRLTAQVAPKHRVTAVMERAGKDRKWMGIESGLIEPRAAVAQPGTLLPCSDSRRGCGYYAQAKWTATLSNKVLVTAGYSTNFYDFTTTYQPEVRRASGSDFGDISHFDLITQRRWIAAAQDSDNPFFTGFVETALSYVTGSHSLKVGFQDRWGYNKATRLSNGDLTQQYRNLVPDSVSIGNYPIESQSDVVDIGLYAQDTWSVRRLTLNLGLRFDYFHGSLPAQDAPAGRFVGPRHFDEIEHLPLWKDVSPRFGLSYDLFGNGKTALKGSIGRYVQQDSTSFQERYNPMVVGRATLAWRDLNGNDIAEGTPGCVYLTSGCEMNFAQLPASFGVRRNRNADPDIPRPYQILATLGIQHELRPGLAVSATYNRRTYGNLSWTQNLEWSSSDFTLVSTPDPRGSGSLPVYILDQQKVSAINEFDLASENNTRTYNGIDLMINARLPNGGTLFGGTSSGRDVSVTCDVTNPNELRFCDQSKYDIPFRTTFKLSGTYPLPYGLQVGAVFQHLLGNEKQITYSVNRTILPSLTVATQLIRLNEPGSSYYASVDQLDLSIGRTFRVRGTSIVPRVQIFNALNTNTISSEVTTFGSALGRPTGILPARLLKIGATIDF